MCLETPISRAISAVVRPASSYFNTPMICSVFSFLFDILLPLSFVRNHTSFRVSGGVQVKTLSMAYHHHRLTVISGSDRSM